jgi:hypothetical protein
LVDFSRCLAGQTEERAIVTTLGYALQRAGAELLELDTREIGVLIVPAGEGGRSYGAVLYDSVAGGAGHVPELLAYGRRWLETARNVMFVNEQHNALYETACLSCLLSFDAQEMMRQNLLHRGIAKEAFDMLLCGGGTVTKPKSHPDTASGSLTDDERLARARQRSRNRK